MHVTRRRLVGVLGGGTALACTSPALTADLLATPRQTRGPFYPLELPLDQDNDLTVVAGNADTAKGQVLDVAGTLRDERGVPLSGVRIEIWQVNAFGRYHHPHDSQNKPWDPGFQGFGHTLTDEQGRYRFRTVRPVAYPGRAPHIHFSLGDRRFETLYTQMYIAGAPENADDFLLRRIASRRARDSLIVELVPASAGPASLQGRFDIVLGQTVLSREPG
ncbi:MAG: intradiol ring-cleavage dioxygenase [Burkholderiales bacterium]|nr:intradiol ring-cleavage dioxygenase [Burkholderiales bacterium]